MDYNHLASELKAALLNDKSALDADRLQSYTGTQSALGFTGSVFIMNCVHNYSISSVAKQGSTPFLLSSQKGIKIQIHSYDG